MTAPAEATSLVNALVLELEDLPASRAAAVQVMRAVDDPEASARDVAAAAAADPALTTRLMRLANSVYYGLSGRVRTPAFAVTVVGFETLRSLAAVAAADLVEPDALPPGFWRRAACAASGASLVARRVGAPQPEAFCVGLLHDLGTALLRQHDIARWEDVVAEARGDDAALLRAEIAAYGGTHAELCAQVLNIWHFPDDLCEAISNHHEVPAMTAPPLRKALQAGLGLADLADRGGPRVLTPALIAARVPAADLPAMVAEVGAAGDQLAAAFSS